MKRNSQAYKCTARHTSFIYPTTKIKQHHSFKILDFDEAASDSDESEAASNNTPSSSDLQQIPRDDPELRPVTPETSGQNQQVHPQQLRYRGNASSPDSTQANPELMQANCTDSMQANTDFPAANTDYLKTDLEMLRRKYNTLLGKHQALLLKQSVSPKEMTVLAIKSVINKSRDLEKKKKKQVEQFVSFILENGFFDGLVRKEILR